jgi:beta-phosphoglucomutase-like phosphatase (HAD superfamily)
MTDAGSGGRRGGRGLGLPSGIRACMFDLDGVLTRTASVHAAAWKTMFDGFLRARAVRTGERLVPFDPSADYAEYVDGRPRQDGVRCFLAARRIALPDGRFDDPPDEETIGGLANWKNELVLALIREQGVEAHEVRSGTSTPSARPISAVLSSRRAPMRARCWKRQGSRTCSTSGWTGSTPNGCI